MRACGVGGTSCTECVFGTVHCSISFPPPPRMHSQCIDPAQAPAPGGSVPWAWGPGPRGPQVLGSGPWCPGPGPRAPGLAPGPGPRALRRPSSSRPQAPGPGHELRPWARGPQGLEM